MKFNNYELGDIIISFDHKRKPLSTIERTRLKGIYPYYGAQEIIDYIDDYIFEGKYILLAEDGENLRSRNKPLAKIVNGKFWLNNHAHIFQVKEGFDLEYVYYFVNNIDIEQYLTGTTQPKLNQANMNKMIMKLPSFENQKKISRILSTIDNKIEVNNQINDHLQKISQELYKKWFLKFDFPNEKGLPYRSSGGEMIDSEIGKIPKEWEVIYANECLEFERGIEPGSSNYLNKKTNETVNFYRVGDILGNCNTFIKSDIVNKKILSKQDVVVSFDGTVGRVAVGLEGSYSTGLRKIYNKNKKYNIYNSFIFEYFKSAEAQKILSQHARGTIILHASSAIDHFKFAYNKNIFESCKVFLDNNFLMILNIIEENKALIKLRDELLSKLITGEINLDKFEI